MTSLRKITIFIAVVLFVFVPLGGILTFVLGLTDLSNIENFLRTWVAQFGLIAGIVLGYYFGFLRRDVERPPTSEAWAPKAALEGLSDQLLRGLKESELSDSQVKALEHSVDDWLRPEAGAARVSKAYVDALNEYRHMLVSSKSTSVSSKSIHKH